MNNIYEHCNEESKFQPLFKNTFFFFPFLIFVVKLKKEHQVITTSFVTSIIDVYNKKFKHIIVSFYVHREVL